MFDYVKNKQSPDFMSNVGDIIGTVVKNISRTFGQNVFFETLLPGKMLRTRFALRLIESDGASVVLEGLANACAATELVHTASLCHDDVIDNGLIRRGVPSLWRTTTPSCSVLIGDLLLSESLHLLLQNFGVNCVNHFLTKVKEVCITEIEQEIIWRGKQLDESICMKIARGKTGPLFGFIGYVLGGSNSHLSSALEEAGYHIGTAYQIYDDFIDIVGNECLSGKTINNDVIRGKITLPQLKDVSPGILNSRISESCVAALECVDAWPHAQRGIEVFFQRDLQPVFDRIQSGIKIVS